MLPFSRVFPEVSFPTILERMGWGSFVFERSAEVHGKHRWWKTCMDFNCFAQKFSKNYLRDRASWQTDVAFAGLFPKGQQQLGQGQAKAMGMKLNPSLPDGFQGPKCLSHHLLAPGCALAGSWNWKQELLRLELGIPIRDAGVKNMSLSFNFIFCEHLEVPLYCRRKNQSMYSQELLTGKTGTCGFFSRAGV